MKAKLLKRLRRRFVMKYIPISNHPEVNVGHQLVVWDKKIGNFSYYGLPLKYRTESPIHSFIRDKYRFGWALVAVNKDDKQHRRNVSEAKRIFGMI